MFRLSIIALIALASALSAADQPAAPDAAKAKPYPLDICIVTGEKLDGMGGAVVVVKDGQEVKFCCKGCIKDFNKDPAKYLKKIADAEKAKVTPAAH
jgi:hypothetical protein